MHILQYEGRTRNLFDGKENRRLTRLLDDNFFRAQVSGDLDTQGDDMCMMGIVTRTLAFDRAMKQMATVGVEAVIKGSLRDNHDFAYTTITTAFEQTCS